MSDRSANWDNYHGYDHGWDGDDWGWALAGAAVGATVGYWAGAAATPTVVTTLPCTATVVTVSNVSYHQCGSTWYNYSYVAGEPSYVVVDAPPGY